VNEFGSEAASNYPEYGGKTFLQKPEKYNIPYWMVTLKTVVITLFHVAESVL
jgi:hypothetical protein